MTLNMGHHQLSCPSASILARTTSPKQGAAHDGACKVVSGQRELAKSFRCITDQELGHWLTVSMTASIHGGDESLSHVAGPGLSLHHLPGGTSNSDSRSRDSYSRRQFKKQHTT